MLLDDTNQPITAGAPLTTPLGEVKKNLSIIIRSFGVKNGQEFPKADLYLDCRGVANPMHAVGLNGTGDDSPVRAWVDRYSNIGPYFEMCRDAFSRLTTRKGNGKEYEKPFEIVCMCAHGIHRSRAVKHILGNILKGVGYERVEVK